MQSFGRDLQINVIANLVAGVITSIILSILGPVPYLPLAITVLAGIMLAISVYASRILRSAGHVISAGLPSRPDVLSR